MPLEKVFGVDHVGEQAEHVVNEMVRPGTTIHKLGLEMLPEHYLGNPGEPLHAYWARICEVTSNRNIPVVSLNPPKKDVAIDLLSSFLVDAINQRWDRNWNGFKKAVLAVTQRSPRSRPHAKALKALLEEIEKNALRTNTLST